MIGAIAGDIIGSVYEFAPIKTTDFPLFSPGCTFTDDTVLTVALAEVILRDGDGADYARTMKEYYRLYPNAGYGERFIRWAQSEDMQPYGSFGNGAAMRISPVGFAYNSVDKVLDAAKKFTAVTHNHPEGIRGGQTVAVAVFLARKNYPKNLIRDHIEHTYGYDLYTPLDRIRPAYQFDETCQGTVPPALRAFVESESYEDAVRKAVSLGGDADTLACITGGIAHAFYRGVPGFIQNKVFETLDERLASVTHQFVERFSLQ